MSNPQVRFASEGIKVDGAQIVYVLHESNWDDNYTVGVFATLDDAKEAGLRHFPQRHAQPGYWIGEYDIGSIKDGHDWEYHGKGVSRSVDVPDMHGSSVGVTGWEWKDVQPEGNQ